MKNYDIYFEIFGKKMKTTTLAETMSEAKQNVINKIKWHKITEKPQVESNQDFDAFKNIMDILGGKTP
jgi:hypothetical protein